MRLWSPPIHEADMFRVMLDEEVRDDPREDVLRRRWNNELTLVEAVEALVALGVERDRAWDMAWVN